MNTKKFFLILLFLFTIILFGCSKIIVLKLSGKIKIANGQAIDSLKITFEDRLTSQFISLSESININPDGSFYLQSSFPNSLPQTVSLRQNGICVDKFSISLKNDSLFLRNLVSNELIISSFYSSDTILIKDFNFNISDKKEDIDRLNFDKIFKNVKFDNSFIFINLVVDPPPGTKLELGNNVNGGNGFDTTFTLTAKQTVLRNIFRLNNLNSIETYGKFISPDGWYRPFSFYEFGEK